MLNDVHNHWKHAETVRIKCLGVPTVDMKNVCTQLEVFLLPFDTFFFTVDFISLGVFHLLFLYILL